MQRNMKVASVTLVESTKIGSRYTIKQTFNFNCSFVHFIHLIVTITIYKTKNKDCDKYLFKFNPYDPITCMVSSYWTIRIYSYGPTVRVYVYSPDRSRTVQILIWSGTSTSLFKTYRRKTSFLGRPRLLDICETISKCSCSGLCFAVFNCMTKN